MSCRFFVKTCALIFFGDPPTSDNPPAKFSGPRMTETLSVMLTPSFLIELLPGPSQSIFQPIPVDKVYQVMSPLVFIRLAMDDGFYGRTAAGLNSDS